MTDPNPAQRADWMRTNDEAAVIRDQLYGKDHRPTYLRVGARYAAACACGCDRAYQPYTHDNWHDALEAARTNLRLAEHGPSAGQEAS